MIREIIVVEGKDDITAVKHAVSAHVVATGGTHFGAKKIREIKELARRNGVIVLTDPDHAGESIRSRISRAVPEAKHAFLPRTEALKDEDIGVENASPESIRRALEKTRPMETEDSGRFTTARLYRDGLLGPESQGRRDAVGAILGIGYANGKQYLSRLNHMGVTEEEYLAALEEVNDSQKGEREERNLHGTSRA